MGAISMTVENKAVEPVIDHDFYGAILDSISACLCVIDRAGEIVYVNRSWREFARCNDGDQDAMRGNYLKVCEAAADAGCQDAQQVFQGLKRLIAGLDEEFSCEYPCHSPNDERWFMLMARPLRHGEGDFFVLKHKEISDRKFHEREIERLSVTDALTGLANRRKFESAAIDLWELHQRSGVDLSLVLIDIDHFKLINDNFGHPYGDQCLREVSRVVARECRRTNDLAARIGGEEIAILLSDTSLEAAIDLADRVRLAVQGLGLEHAAQASFDVVTVSLGVAAMVPAKDDSFAALYKLADQALYQAKHSGRNRVCTPNAVADS